MEKDENERVVGIQICLLQYVGSILYGEAKKQQEDVAPLCT